jgi:hypothetical protein
MTLGGVDDRRGPLLPDDPPAENEWCSRVPPYLDTVGTIMPHRFEGGDAFLHPLEGGRGSSRRAGVIGTSVAVPIHPREVEPHVLPDRALEIELRHAGGMFRF